MHFKLEISSLNRNFSLILNGASQKEKTQKKKKNGKYINCGKSFSLHNIGYFSRSVLSRRRGETKKTQQNQMVIQKDFLGGNIMKKCDRDCDKALIKSSWRPV